MVDLYKIESNDDQIRPRQRRSRGGMGSQSRGSSSHVQDSVSPHSSYHTSPSPLLAPAAPAPAAAPAPGPAAAPGPPGVMTVAELVRQPGRDHLPYLTEYPHGHGQTWFNRSGNGISAWINRMMYSALDSGHPTFTHFPVEKQHLWFRQFAKALLKRASKHILTIQPDENGLSTYLSFNNRMKNLHILSLPLKWL
ncbi:hypothetical protein YC2023_066547 [Brassica napus]